MKKFKFKFETVKTVRKKQEDDTLRSLAAAQRAFQFEIARKNKLLSDLEQALIQRETLGSQPTGIVEFQSVQSFINGTKVRILQSDQAIFRASRAVEKAMRVYLDARKKRKMMDALYEKAYQEYRDHLAKKEENELNDLAVMRSRLKQEAL